MKHKEVVQMSLFTTIKKRYAQITPKQFIVTGVFALAFAAAIAGGFAARTATTAATLRDCDNNSIMTCGSADTKEFIGNIKDNNNGRNTDLKGIYGHFGLTSSKYSDFQTYAKDGTFFRDGHVEVAGKTVAIDGHSMGRKNFGGSQSYAISGVGTYFEGTPNQRWADGVASLPVMVWFDNDGNVKMIVMKPCGNPVPFYDKKSPSYSCDMLIKHPVKDKKNTYTFTADASTNNLATATKFIYSYNDGSGWKVFAKTNSESTETDAIEFTKATKVRVDVEITLMSGKKKIITSESCEKEIGVVKEEFLHVCQALIKTAVDTKTFRFNVIDKHSDNVERLSADFTLDGSVTAKGVTTDEDKDGFIDRTYTFTDNKAHKVSAVVNFKVNGKVVKSTETCVAITDKTPECKPNIPVGDERCKDFCKPGIEVGSKECEELPKTGAAGVTGMFAGVSAAGAALHRLYVNRKRR